MILHSLTNKMGVIATLTCLSRGQKCEEELELTS